MDSSPYTTLLFGYLLYDLAGLRVVAFACDVGLRQNADEPTILLDYRQAADLVLRHQAQRLVEVLLRIDRHEVGGCNLADLRRPRVLAFGNDADRYVAVSDHASQTSALGHRNNACVRLLHDPSGFDHRAVRLDCRRVGGHDVTDVLTHTSSLLPTPRHFPVQRAPKRENCKTCRRIRTVSVHLHCRCRRRTKTRRGASRYSRSAATSCSR